MRMILRILSALWGVVCSAIRLVLVGLTALSLVIGGLALANNYNATPGSGLTFGSVVIGGVNFMSMLICDFTTANQCAAVKAANTAAAATDPSLVVQNAQEHTDLSSIITNTAAPLATQAATVSIGGVGGVLTTSGGWTPKLLNGLSTTVTAIKSSAAGQLGMLQCGNTNASEEYVQVFDVATAGGVTLGSTTPKLSIPIPATNSDGFTLALTGFQFANGIQIAATTTATGSSAPGTALDCNAGFN